MSIFFRQLILGYQIKAGQFDPGSAGVLDGVWIHGVILD